MCYRCSEYKAVQQNEPKETLFDHFRSAQKYHKNHIRQKGITEGIIEDLIIGMALPMDIVENPFFRRYYLLQNIFVSIN